MTTLSERRAEALNIIGNNPGIQPGQLSARCTLSNSSNFQPLLQSLLTECLAVRTGMGESSCYHLTDAGHKELAELAGEYLAEACEPEDSDAGSTIHGEVEELAAAFADLPVITAGFGDVVLEQVSEPLPVIDSDLSSLDEALAQLSELVLDAERPVNLSDLIEFNRRGAALIRRRAPVPAALMDSTANALERAYLRQ